MIIRKRKQQVIHQGVHGGVDYNIYDMNASERLRGYTICFTGAFVSSFILFRLLLVSFIIGIITGIIMLPFYRKSLIQKRKNMLLMQFSDFLEALAGSYSSGKNTFDAFAESHHDMCQQYSSDSLIANEISTIMMGLQNNYTIEAMLEDFASRSRLEDIASFVSTFIVCQRQGGNMKEIVFDTKEMIHTKIEIEMDIATTITEKKNELNIMIVMPLIIVLMLGTLGSAEITANNPLNIFVKVVATGIFILSYWVGRRITNIRV